MLQGCSNCAFSHHLCLQMQALKFDASAKQFTTMLGQPIILQLDAAPVVNGAQNSSIILSSKVAPACQASILTFSHLLSALRMMVDCSWLAAWLFLVIDLHS